ncbi:hypothetical protein FACS1894184_04780 [Clostridia bacterium]|nr:hypothetical protein FACS1894184_04780 [Clostridia bacterium]
MAERQRIRRADRHAVPTAANPPEPNSDVQGYDVELIPPRRPVYSASESRGHGYREDEPPRTAYPIDNRRQQYPQQYNPPPLPTSYQYAPVEPPPPVSEPRVKCKRCGSTNVQVSREQVGSKTGIKGLGCLWSLGRAMLMIVTLGLWGIFGKKRSAAKTKNKYRTIAVCQSCGKSWYL